MIVAFFTIDPCRPRLLFIKNGYAVFELVALDNNGQDHGTMAGWLFSGTVQDERVGDMRVQS